MIIIKETVIAIVGHLAVSGTLDLICFVTYLESKLMCLMELLFCSLYQGRAILKLATLGVHHSTKLALKAL